MGLFSGSKKRQRRGGSSFIPVGRCELTLGRFIRRDCDLRPRVFLSTGRPIIVRLSSHLFFSRLPASTKWIIRDIVLIDLSAKRAARINFRASQVPVQVQLSSPFARHSRRRRALNFSEASSRTQRRDFWILSWISSDVLPFKTLATSESFAMSLQFSEASLKSLFCAWRSMQKAAEAFAINAN